MGNTCECCQGDTLSPSQSELKGTPWAKAIGDGSLTGVKMLHHEDVKLLDDVLNTGGQTAIHVATTRKHYEVMAYLLDEGCRVNKKAVRTGNTALHEAARVGDREAVRILLKHGADPKKRNRRKATPDKLTADTGIHKMLTNAKKARLESKKSNSPMPPEYGGSSPGSEVGFDDKPSLSGQRMSLRIQGMSLTAGKSNTRKAAQIITTTQTEHEELLREKAEDTERKRKMKDRLRGKVDPNAEPTEFAQKMGCDLYEVAAFLTRMPEKKKMWTVFIGKKKKITTSRDLFKLIYGLTQTTLRKTNRGRGQPPKDPVKDVVKRMEAKISGGHRQFELNIDQFESKFAEWLFIIAENMREETDAELAKQERFLMREAAADLFNGDSSQWDV